jgi:hypothetical protein
VHDIALKAAETDATKRALATFGKPFGLELYRGGKATASQKSLFTRPKLSLPRFAVAPPSGKNAQQCVLALAARWQTLHCDQGGPFVQSRQFQKGMRLISQHMEPPFAAATPAASKIR